MEINKKIIAAMVAEALDDANEGVSPAEEVEKALKNNIKMCKEFLDHAKVCTNCGRDIEKVAAIRNCKTKAEGVLIALAAYKEAEEALGSLAKKRNNKGEN